MSRQDNIEAGRRLDASSARLALCIDQMAEPHPVVAFQ
jgi:hypothetical protein